MGENENTSLSQASQLRDYKTLACTRGKDNDSWILRLAKVPESRFDGLLLVASQLEHAFLIRLDGPTSMARAIIAG
jgi:hypothetical protein